MSPVPASADRLCSARHRGSVASVEGGNRPLGGKAFTSVQCLVASAGDDLFSYAAAAAAVAVANSSGGEDGGKPISPYALFNSPLTTPFPKVQISGSICPIQLPLPVRIQTT